MSATELGPPGVGPARREAPAARVRGSAATTTAAVAPAPFDVQSVRAQFPALARPMNGHPLVYLDSAATAQKPQRVLDAHARTYVERCANIHRGVYRLSAEATRAFENVRPKVRRYFNLPDKSEVIFTRGTTEAINLVANSWGTQNVRAGDEIIVSQLEHHSNIVPWQMLCARVGATLRVAPIDDTGALNLDAFAALLGPKTKLVAMSHISNALGTVLPIAEVVRLAHAHGAVVLVDGAQAVPHARVDVGALGCDFYAFSAHKLFGPAGVGVLWGKKTLLDAMPPWQGGGDMIASVSFDKTTYAEVPHKFEAGTPDFPGIIALGAALDFCTELDWDGVTRHEADLLAYGTQALLSVPGLRLIGTAANKASVLSFVMDCSHPHDVGTVLDTCGVAIRSGHHCAQPVMKRFGVAATARASLALYNTRAEIDVLVRGLHKVRRLFAGN